MAVFQPGEETARRRAGDDRRRALRRAFPSPTSCSASTSWSGRPGRSPARAGAITSAADSLQIRLFGRGAHGSMPQASIDPVVMAAATVLRLQTIVSREVAAAEAAVVTVGVPAGRHEGERHPRRGHHQAERADLRRGVRKRVLAAIERIVNAEAAASGAPRTPEITPLDRYPAQRQRSARRASAWSTRSAGTFPPSACARPGRRRRARTSDRSAPSGTRPPCSGSSAAPIPSATRRPRRAGRLNEIPTNHNPRFAPVIHPTLQTGVEALIVATTVVEQYVMRTFGGGDRYD